LSAVPPESLGVYRHWVRRGKWESLKRCSQCRKKVHSLSWLKDADGLPLTMPLCAVCIQPALQSLLENDVPENLHKL
jgi:hypothetical protein